MAEIGFGVQFRSYSFNDSKLTFNLAAGITKADEGKAVSLDTSADNQVKLAGDGEAILGRLEVVEDRAQAGILVGTVALRFAGTLPQKNGEVIARGDAVQGAGNGEVKALPVSTDTAGPGPTNITHASHDAKSQVVEVRTGDIVVVLFNV